MVDARCAADAGGEVADGGVAHELVEGRAGRPPGRRSTCTPGSDTTSTRSTGRSTATGLAAAPGHGGRGRRAPPASAAAALTPAPRDRSTRSIAASTAVASGARVAARDHGPPHAEHAVGDGHHGGAGDAARRPRRGGRPAGRRRRANGCDANQAAAPPSDGDHGHAAEHRQPDRTVHPRRQPDGEHDRADGVGGGVGAAEHGDAARCPRSTAAPTTMHGGAADRGHHARRCRGCGCRRGRRTRGTAAGRRCRGTARRPGWRAPRPSSGAPPSALSPKATKRMAGRARATMARRDRQHEQRHALERPLHRAAELLAPGSPASPTSSGRIAVWSGWASTA